MVRVGLVVAGIGVVPVGAARVRRARRARYGPSRRAFHFIGERIDVLRKRPATAFAAFLLFSIVIYLPMRLIFGDLSWLTAGHHPLVIQTSRILLYAAYFLPVSPSHGERTCPRVAGGVGIAIQRKAEDC